MKIECVLECANHLGEGPVWDVCTNGPCWSPDNKTFADGSSIDEEGCLWSLFKVTGLGVRGLPEPRFAA